MKIDHTKSGCISELAGVTVLTLYDLTLAVGMCMCAKVARFFLGGGGGGRVKCAQL